MRRIVWDVAAVDCAWTAPWVGGQTVRVGGKMSLRVSDDERHVAVTRLREGYADGQLTHDELLHRLDVAYGATTRGELVPITEDLPQHVRPRRTDTRRLRMPWFYVEVNAVLWSIWLAQEVTGGGATHDLWPLWLSVPWGAYIVVQRARPRRRRPAH